MSQVERGLQAHRRDDCQSIDAESPFTGEAPRLLCKLSTVGVVETKQMHYRVAPQQEGQKDWVGRPEGCEQPAGGGGRGGAASLLPCHF
jgi:hypothetical protein